MRQNDGMLHITNGSSVALKQTTLGGEVVYWTDVLHEGPVPAGMTPAQLSRVREKFLSDYYGEPAMCFADRDAAIARAGDHDEVTLWFEHDLFDQLQLIQILDRFGSEDIHPARLTLINVDRYLGALQPSELEILFEQRQDVTQEQIETAAAAWKLFRNSEPGGLENFVRRGSTALPFLKSALQRHLEQFPSLRNGVSRTEGQILALIREKASTWRELFERNQRMEEAVFMGDTTFRRYLRRMAESRRPLITTKEDHFELTVFGRAVLEGAADHVRENGINRWLGGVHLCAGAPIWRWDAGRSQLSL